MALGILSTFGPAPGSIEGLVYTIIPVSDQLVGLTEVVPQAFLFSLVLFFWVRHPEKRFGDRFVLVAGHCTPLLYSVLAVLNEPLRILARALQGLGDLHDDPWRQPGDAAPEEQGERAHGLDAPEVRCNF